MPLEGYLRRQGFRIEILRCSSLPHTPHRLYVYTSLHIETDAHPIPRPARVEPETRQEKASAFSCSFVQGSSYAKGSFSMLCPKLSTHHTKELSLLLLYPS